MAKSPKVVNYSDADLSVLKAGYTGADNAGEVSALAAKLGKTPASVRAKLASMKLYKATEKVEKDGEKVNKTALASAIGEKVGLLEAEVEGLAKAPKAALAKVLANLA